MLLKCYPYHPNFLKLLIIFATGAVLLPLPEMRLFQYMLSASWKLTFFILADQLKYSFLNNK